MKTTFNLYSYLFFSFLFVFQTFHGQKKEDDSISFSIFNHGHEIERGIWFGTIEKEKVCIQLMDSKSQNDPSFLIGLCIPKSEFTLNDNTTFELQKPSGTIKFQGVFPNKKANGDFLFVKNRDFEAFLQREGILIDGEDNFTYFKLYLGDISREYVHGLKKHGYQPTLNQLGKLGIHDVDLTYIDALEKTNYKGLNLDMLLKFVIHDISIYYIKALDKAGYGDIDANMIKKFAIHDISIDYINSLAGLGYGNLEPNMIKSFAVHDIGADYIRGLKSVGFENLDPNMLKKFAIHQITPKYIKSIRDVGVNELDANTFRKAKIHGLTANYIKRAKEKGHNSNELSDYIRLKIHGK